MDWKDNINCIKEIYPGHFQIILDFATIDFLKFVISDHYKYVWIYSYETRDFFEWKHYSLPLFNNKKNHEVLACNISFDLILETKVFKAILADMGPGIMMAQFNDLPKYYLRPATVKGKTRYDLLLKECDYLFEIDIPSATDFGTIVSSNREFLQALLDNKEIDWQNLP